MTTSAEMAGGRRRRAIQAVPLWLRWLGVTIPLAFLYPPTVDLVPADGLYLALGIAATVTAALGVRRNRPARAAAWWTITGGLGLTVAGDIVYAAVTLVTGDEPPFPGLPDLLYLPGLTAIAAGGVLLAWQRHRTANVRSLIDAGLVAVTAAALLWLAIGAETVRTDGATLAVVSLGLAYPLLDAILVGVLAALLFGGRRSSVAIRLLATAFGIQFLADTIYLTEAVEGMYTAGGLLDVAWLVTYVLITSAVLHPSMAVGAEPLPARLHVFAPRHIAGLVSPVVVAAASLVYVAHTSSADDPQRFVLDLTVLAPTGVLVTVLLVWRVANVSNELTRTAHERDIGLLRELVVTDVASRLARADTEAAVRAALQHGAELLPVADGVLQLRDIGDDRQNEGTVWRHQVSETAELVAVASEPVLDDHARSLERVASDVSMALDRCRLAEELRSSERRFRSLVRHAPDAITVHDADGVLTYVSPALGSIVGMPEGSLEGRRLEELVHPDHLDEIRATHTALADRPTSTSVLELRLRHHDGSWRWTETRFTNLVHDPSVSGIVANHRDITERQRLQRQLEHQATHDPLTGAANRRRFADEARHSGAPGTDAVVFLDLDHFKAINDRLGHAAGDQVLCAVAARLRRGVRPGDLVARLGGDEFAVLLRDTDPETAAFTAERLLEAILAPIDLGGEQVTVGASLGLASSSRDGGDHDLLRDADLAMYEAKSGGRGRIERATPRIRELTSRRRSLENDLRQALTDGDLTLRHRPVVDLRTGEVVSAQTELHWVHPTEGEVPADRFIPVAERIGVLDALATWTFQEACWSVRSWIDHRPDLTIAVPFPGVALHAPGAADRFDAVLRATGLPGRHLVLQIRGSELLDPTPAIDDNLRRLREAGVRIRATNLGTDTPMRVVRDAPVDEVLLPAALVAGIAAGPEDAALARAVLLLAESFGLEVVADGIETTAQVEALIARGARAGAGPWAGAAVPPDGLARMLTVAPSTLVAPPG